MAELLGDARATSDTRALKTVVKKVGLKPPNPSVANGVRVTSGMDTHRYVRGLNTFYRPSLAIPGSIEFEWPLGTEGFTIQGSPTLAQHHYIGDNAVVVEVIHRDERRITMNGIFPGDTGAKNMQLLIDVLTRPYPTNGKLLTLPLVFPHAQFVVHEDYSFQREEGVISDNSVAYTITFIRTGVGEKAKLPTLAKPKISKAPPRGETHRYKIVGQSTRTLRAIAALRDVFADANQWKDLYSLNKEELQKRNIPLVKAATAVLPLGMKIFIT